MSTNDKSTSTGLKEITGDIWEQAGDRYVVIPINNGGVMGRGLAFQAQQKWPKQCAKDSQRRQSTAVQVDGLELELPLVFFPVKDVWWEDAKISLIRRSAWELSKAINDSYFQVALPRIGCGFGRLTWDEVWPVLEAELFSKVPEDSILLVAPAEDLPNKYKKAFRPAAKPYWLRGNQA